ncbi:MAG: pyridoxal phosphate-dependent aminotransferase [Thermoplasmataceae archaeon]
MPSQSSENRGIPKTALSRRSMAIDDSVFKLALGLPRDVISLTAGEPDFPSSDFVNIAAKKAMDENFTHYTSSNGISELREAISRKLRVENGMDYGKDEIVVSPGSSSSIFLLLFGLADRGDEVIIPDPAWFHYSILSELAGLKPVRFNIVKDDGIRIEASDIEEKVTDKSRLMILNTPANPTGHVLSRSELEDVAGVAERNNITVISDEIYEKILYDDHKHISLGSLNGMKERTITVNGLSKGYAMMGWRVGYAASTFEISEKLTSLLGYTMVCAGSVAQKAAIEALENPRSKDYVKKMVETWSRRRKIVMSYIERNRDLMTLTAPEGTFYAWINIAKSGLDGKEFSKVLLRDYKVGVMPGYLFGESGKDFVRISFATDDKSVDEGMKRIEQCLRKHKK